MTTLCSTCASELPEGLPSCPRCETATAAPPPPAPLSSPLFTTTTEDLEGLSGWLILVGLGLVVSPFVILGTTLSVNLPFLSDSKYQAFLTGHPGVAALIVFEVITNIVFVIGLAALNFLFFTKRRAFPTYMILYLAAHFVVIFLDTIAAQALLPTASLTGAYKSLGQSLGGALIWIPYFLVSRRVKATFVK
jgi:hypothetical protein